MMLTILAESAVRSLVLGSVVWVGLNLFRVRNPHLHMTSWIMVLVASLSMPFLMDWITVSVTLAPLPAAAPENLWAAGSPWSESVGASLPPEAAMPVPARGEIHHAVNWWVLATAVYAIVAGMLLLRLAVGIFLTWRLVCAAKPITEPWAAHSDVRVSDAISGPVTFGSTILLPAHCVGWDAVKRRAVLAHEGAHVANRDFHILLLASLNRSVFWFSPFAWWQLVRLAELAEIISDASAIVAVEDQVSYAEILLDFVQGGRAAPAGLEMARACTVRARVERILAATAAPVEAGWQKRIWTVAAILPVVVISAGSIAAIRPPASPAVVDRAQDAATPARPRQQVDFYSFSPTSVFTVFHDGEDRFGQLTGHQKLHLAMGEDGTYSYPATVGRITFAASDDERQASELVLRQNGRDLRLARIAEVPREGAQRDARLIESYVGWYELSPSRVLTVTRDGDRLAVQETGRSSKYPITAQGGEAFASAHDDLVVFLRATQTSVTGMLFQDAMSGARIAPRIDSVRAKVIEDRFARRIAEIPDRFRDQTPSPGSKDMVLRGIDGMQRSAPDYDRMSASLAGKIRRQASQMRETFKALGAVESVFFRGVGPGGYDIYGAKFANGSAEIRLLQGPDGKAEDVMFRADGNGAPGGVLACSSEPGLKAHGETSPITVSLFNETGKDVQLFRLDADGKRVLHATIGDTMSSTVQTFVDSPWVAADASGQCLEIVMPGQRTRFRAIEASHEGGAAPQAIRPRNTPMAGSEDTLRRYIEDLRRSQPDYDRMTAEVAAQTRLELPYNEAILARLGALRSLSFRGVTMIGSDIYMAHFANGTAEWRIGLGRNGTISRISLGPQS